MFYSFLWNFRVTDYCQISSIENFLLCTCQGRWRGGGWKEKFQFGKLMNQRCGAQAQTHQQDGFAQWFFDIAEFFPEITVFTIRKLALRTNEIKRYIYINHLNRIIHTFDLRQTLPKYIRTFYDENAVMMIGLTDQSDYSICHFKVRVFICTVGNTRGGSRMQNPTRIPMNIICQPVRFFSIHPE